MQLLFWSQYVSEGEGGLLRYQIEQHLTKEVVHLYRRRRPHPLFVVDLTHWSLRILGTSITNGMVRCAAPTNRFKIVTCVAGWCGVTRARVAQISRCCSGLSRVQMTNLSTASSKRCRPRPKQICFQRLFGQNGVWARL